MSDKEPVEPMSDEAIEGLVRMVEAAELLSKSLDCSCADALRTMLKSFQIMTKIQNGADTSKLLKMVSPTRKVQ